MGTGVDEGAFARSTQVHPAIDVQGLAGDVARARAGQEAHRSGDFLRRAERPASVLLTL